MAKHLVYIRHCDNLSGFVTVRDDKDVQTILKKMKRYLEKYNYNTGITYNVVEGDIVTAMVATTKLSIVDAL